MANVNGYWRWRKPQNMWLSLWQLCNQYDTHIINWFSNKYQTCHYLWLLSFLGFPMSAFELTYQRSWMMLPVIWCKINTICKLCLCHCHKHLHVKRLGIHDCQYYRLYFTKRLKTSLLYSYFLDISYDYFWISKHQKRRAQGCSQFTSNL